MPGLACSASWPVRERPPSQYIVIAPSRARIVVRGDQHLFVACATPHGEHAAVREHQLQRPLEHLRLGHEADLAPDVAAHQEVVHEREVVRGEDHRTAPGDVLDRDRPCAQQRVRIERCEHPHDLVHEVRFARPRALVEAVEVLLGPRVRVDLLAHRREITHLLAHPARRLPPPGRQGYAPIRPTPSPLQARTKIAQLARAVREAGGRAPAGAVARVELELLHARAGARRVDRHRELHPIARARTAAAPEHARAHRALAAEIGARARSPQRCADRPPRKAPRDAEAAPLTRCESRHRQVGAPVADHLHERRQRAADSPRSPSHSRNTASAPSADSALAAPGARRRSSPRPCRPGARLRDDAAPATARERGGVVARAVVGDPQLAPAAAPAAGGERGRRCAPASSRAATITARAPAAGRRFGRPRCLLSRP